MNLCPISLALVLITFVVQCLKPSKINCKDYPLFYKENKTRLQQEQSREGPEAPEGCTGAPAPGSVNRATAITLGLIRSV